LKKEKDFYVMVTGHRPNKLLGYDKNNPVRKYIFNIMSEVLSILKNKHKKIIAISGMAQGTDQDFCLVCLSLDIPYLSYVPFKGQENMWPEQSKKEYKELLNKSCEVKIISEGKYSPKKMQIRNESMSNDCDIAIAVWDGKDHGGTFNCVRYLKSTEKPIIHINPLNYNHPNNKKIVVLTNNKTSLVHCKKEKYNVYIGRPSIYGNLWTHRNEKTKAAFIVSSREEAVECYRQWLEGTNFTEIEQEKRQQILDSLSSLKGKILGCFCSPLSCHGDVLMDLIKKL